MASSIMPCPPPFQDPVPPDDTCMFPSMRYETFRVASMAQIAEQELPEGVFITKMTRDGFFRTLEGWIMCFDCGLHYGLGHHPSCKADRHNVPFTLAWEEKQNERAARDAVEISTRGGTLRLRREVRERPSRPPVQPSCGPMDLSRVRPVAAGRGQPNPIEEGGFELAMRNAARCPECGKVFQLEMLTPLAQNSSLKHILDQHKTASPRCSSRCSQRPLH